MVCRSFLDQLNDVRQSLFVSIKLPSESVEFGVAGIRSALAKATDQEHKSFSSAQEPCQLVGWQIFYERRHREWCECANADSAQPLESFSHLIGNVVCSMRKINGVPSLNRILDTVDVRLNLGCVKLAREQLVVSKVPIQ